MLAIKNAKVQTVTKGVIENGTILIEDDKIVAVGQSIEIPRNAEIWDADGKWITPGLINIQNDRLFEGNVQEISLNRNFGFVRTAVVSNAASDMKIVRPFDFAKSKLERWNLRFEKLVEMEQNGVEFCFARDEDSGPRLHLSMVGMAITRGLSVNAALCAHTMNPAKLLGLDSAIGSIDVGKIAELSNGYKKVT